MTAQAMAPGPGAGGSHYWKAYFSLFLAGMVGVLSLLLILPDLMRSQPLPPGAPEPSSNMMALSLVNPTLILMITVAAGLRMASRFGFRSHLVERVQPVEYHRGPFREEIPLAAAAGVAVSALVVVLDRGFQRASAGVVPQDGSWSPAQLVSGILYGGITEEVMLRWGLMSALVWVGWRFVQRSEGTPRAGVVWFGILGAALFFGAGHLPAAAAAGIRLTGLAMARIVGLNALAGIVFGWLFWKRSLEAAMVAHASSHVVFALAALATGSLR